jgi:copper chaperone CopZ
MNAPTPHPPTTLTFAVEGMSCGNCVRHIDAAIREGFPGASADVDLGTGRVSVRFEPGTASAEAIARVLEEEGYPARPL